MSLLRVSGVSVRLGGLQILDDVSFQVPENTIVGLIGPNGAGKTTAFNVICGFVKPASGAVSWRDVEHKMHPHGLADLGIARTLQGVGLFESLTVVRNVMLGAFKNSRRDPMSALLGFPTVAIRDAQHRERAMELLAEFEILDVADRFPGDLPYPIRKRIALARALMSDPALVMLDEPAGGISQADIRALGTLVKNLKSRCSVLVVEHHMDFVMDVCDRIYVLDAGRIIAEGDPAAIQSNAAVRAAYLGESVA